eukprot:3299266-Karenia_brevis.AAC.1
MERPAGWSLMAIRAFKVHNVLDQRWVMCATLTHSRVKQITKAHDQGVTLQGRMAMEPSRFQSQVVA